MNNEKKSNCDQSGQRLEHDLLGEELVPDDSYYGIHTLRAMNNFSISNQTISDVPEFVRGMIYTKQAAAMANKELDVLPHEIADSIIEACNLILSTGKCMDQFNVDVYQGGAGTSVNMNTNEVLANVALELMDRKKGDYQTVNPNNHVNCSQSTNDVYPTGFRVALFTSVEHLLERLEELIQSFREKGKEFKDILKMGRTQLQDAVPMTLGQEFHGFSVTLNEEVKNIKRTRELLLEINLGATAIGTGVNAPEGYSEAAVRFLAEITEIPFTQAEDLVEATSDCGAYVMLSGALKRFAVKLSKICNDLRLLSSGPRAGMNEINLPRMQAGSSIMPAKVNPVIPEVVNQVAYKVIGNDLTVTMAAESGQLQLNVMEPVIAQSMFESISLLMNACETLKQKCVTGITANQEVCQDNVFNSIGLVTYLNPIIGHHEGDQIGKICADENKRVRDVVLDRGLMSEEHLDSILSVENMIKQRR